MNGKFKNLGQYQIYISPVFSKNEKLSLKENINTFFDRFKIKNKRFAELIAYEKAINEVVDCIEIHANHVPQLDTIRGKDGSELIDFSRSKEAYVDVKLRKLLKKMGYILPDSVKYRVNTTDLQ